MRQSVGKREQQQQQQQREGADEGADGRMSKKSVKLEPKGGPEQDTTNNIGKRKGSPGATNGAGARKRERRGENVPNEQQMTQQQQQQQQQLLGREENVCAACLKPIRERYLLVALDKRWHEDCLKCACCDCRLGEVGSSLFTDAGKIFCRRDYLRIYGQKGLCATCKRSIPPYELVMRAGDNAYHIDCFACQQCQYRFCVGDQFQLDEQQRIVCLGCHLHLHEHQQQLELQMGPVGACQQLAEAPKQVPAPAADPPPTATAAAAAAAEVGGQGRRRSSPGPQ